MRPAHVSRTQRGLTLVELMVALVLGLLLMAVVGQVYLVNRATFTAQEQQGLLQEGGRFALEFLARDARMAGLTGCSSRRPPDQPLQVRNYLNNTSYPFDPMLGVRGYDANGTRLGADYDIAATYPEPSGSASDWSPALPGTLDDEAIAGSDVLVLTGMDVGIPLVAPYTSGSQVFVANVGDIVVGDVLMVTDCQQAQVFQATNVTAGSGNIVGSGAAGFVPGNAGPIAERGPAGPFQNGSEVARVRAYAYFVGVGASDAPALFRQSLGSDGTSAALNPEELIDGVESMQVQYGVDDDLDFIVDRYLDAATVPDWNLVRAIRVGLLVRTPEEYGTDADAADYDVAGTTIDPVDDRRVRRVFTSTIALRNRLL